MRVYEWEDGRVEIHAEGRSLPYSIFDQKLTVRQKDRIWAARDVSQPSEPESTSCDRLGAVAAYFQQFENEQEERRKAKNLKAAQRRKERGQPPTNRTFLLGGKPDISTWP